MADRKPQHLSMFNGSWVKWDWRKENPAEVVLVVFALTFFLLLPRQGCGVTQTGPPGASAPPAAPQAPLGKAAPPARTP